MADFVTTRASYSESLDAAAQARFWSRVEKGESCWKWTGTLDAFGYGLFRVRTGNAKAHRVSYELERGRIPDGLTIDHLCRNRACVNPAHLEAVTQRVNVLRGENITAQQARQTHCKRGHELAPPNLGISTRGKRLCLACQREQTRSAYAASLARGMCAKCGQPNDSTRALCAECRQKKSRRERAKRAGVA